MEYTQTALVNAAIADPANAPMTLEQIVSEEIREFKQSSQYAELLQAEEYYRNRSDVQKKTSDMKNRSNTRIEHPAYRKLVDQKVRYLLARPWAVETDDRQYGAALEALFDAAFRRKIKSLGRGAVKCGIAWIQPYINDSGALAFMRVPAHELVPLWRDAERTELDGFIRFYDQVIYVGRDRKTISRAEYWFSGGVRWFLCADGSGEYRVDTERGTPETEWTEPHFTLGDKAYNWENVPLLWLRYNEEELPLLHYVKELIDDYNWQTSVTADVLRDVAKFIYILKNYGGADLDEFVRDLRQAMAVKVDGDGGVDKLQADINIEAVMSFLDKQRRDLFDFASAVDTKDADLGNASGTAINFRYMDLDADCADLADELQDTFGRMKPFLDTWLQATGKGDFTGMTFSVAFNMDLPVNETDIIGNINVSRDILSQRTLLSNHPWVKNVDAEIEQLGAEKEEAMRKYGDGLFDNELGRNGEGVTRSDE
jgi:SPP1 family phage portal protein